MISVWKTVKNRKLLVERNLSRLLNDSSIIFQITTCSATKTTVVRRGIQSITSSAEKVDLANYQISVVTDDPWDRWTLKDEKCEVVVVEKNYHTNAIKKGRALQYAVEHRQRFGKNTSKRWIFHMDEESYMYGRRQYLLCSNSLERAKQLSQKDRYFIRSNSNQQTGSQPIASQCGDLLAMTAYLRLKILRRCTCMAATCLLDQTLKMRY